MISNLQSSFKFSVIWIVDSFKEGGSWSSPRLEAGPLLVRGTTPVIDASVSNKFADLLDSNQNNTNKIIKLNLVKAKERYFLKTGTNTYNIQKQKI